MLLGRVNQGLYDEKNSGNVPLIVQGEDFDG
jgi:hypothetical protein